MGIFAIVAVLGIFGFVSFRVVVQTRQALTEVISVAKETKNLAKNNVLPKDVKTNVQLNTNSYLFGYAITFDEGTPAGNDIKRYLCRRAIGSVDTSWTCPVPGTTAESLKSGIFSQLKFNVTNGNNCKRIIFENLTGDLKTTKAANFTSFSETNCPVVMNHSSQPASDYVVNFNALNNSFE